MFDELCKKNGGSVKLKDVCKFIYKNKKWLSIPLIYAIDIYLIYGIGMNLNINPFVLIIGFLIFATLFALFVAFKCPQKIINYLGNITIIKCKLEDET